MLRTLQTHLHNIFQRRTDFLAGARAMDWATLVQFFDLIEDAVIIFTPTFHIEFFSTGAERTFGYPAEEMNGQPLDRLLPERFVNVHRAHMAVFAAGDVPRRLMNERPEVAGRRKDGREFPAEISIAKLGHGSTLRLVAIIRDITVRKSAERALLESEERFRRLFDYSHDAIIILDPDQGVIVDANPRACTLLEYSLPELTSLSTVDIYPEHSLEFETFTRTVRQQGMGWTDVLTCRTRTGNDIPVELSASLVTLEAQQLIVALMRDTRARAALERMKEQFVSNVSHELRTPITSIKLSHKLLQTYPEKREELLGRLTRETERLIRIVDDLLQLSKLEHDQDALQRVPIDLNQLLREYITDRQPLAEHRQLALRFEPEAAGVQVQGDRGMLGQVLEILLTNAFNYTRPGGEITVRTLRAARQAANWAGFSVSDTGQGIATEERGQLFDRFFRGTAGYSMGVPGTGLGLAIAHEIITAHQGEIDVFSAGKDLGATFTIWLPVQPPPPTEQTASPTITKEWG